MNLCTSRYLFTYLDPDFDTPGPSSAAHDGARSDTQYVITDEFQRRRLVPSIA